MTESEKGATISKGLYGKTRKINVVRRYGMSHLLEDTRARVRLVD